MLFLAFVVANLAIAGLAQTIESDVAQIPSCAVNCLSPAITAAGCGQVDWACICGSGKDVIRENALPCIISTCSNTEILSTQQLGTEICDLEANILNSTTSASSSATTAQTTATSSTFLTVTSSSSSALSTTNANPSSITPASTGSGSSTSPSSTNATPESSTSVATSKPEPKDGLSKAAIAGIGVSGAVGALVLAAVVRILVFGCRQRRRDLKHLATLPVVEEEEDNNQMGPYELCGVSHVNELSSENVQILGSGKVGIESRKNNGLEECRGS